MKKTALLTVALLLVCGVAFAANTYKEVERVYEGKTLSVIVEYNIDGKSVTKRVPIYGDYDEDYIDKSLNNELSVLEVMSGNELSKEDSISDVASYKTQLETQRAIRESDEAQKKSLSQAAAQRRGNIGVVKQKKIGATRR